MKNFLRLCHFERKKLFQKNYVRIAFGLIIGITLFINCYPLVQRNQIAYVDEDGKVIVEEVSYYEEVQLERQFAKQFNGKQLTNEVAEQVREFDKTYKKYTQISDDNKSYIPFLNVRLPYRSLVVMGINPDGNLENLADAAYEDLVWSQNRKLQGLSREEIQYWIQERERAEIPFTMYYAEGYRQVLDKAYWINIMGLLFVVLCLCSVFSEDIACGTDPIVRASRFGTTRVSLARLAVGEGIACMVILLLFGITAAIQFGVHGISGGKVPIQMLETVAGHGAYYFTDRCGALVTGEAVFIVLVISLLSVLMMGAITMLLSKVFAQNIPSVVISYGILFIPFIFSNFYYDYDTMPNSLIHHIFSYFPFRRLKVEEFLIDMRLVKVFGGFLNAGQMSVLLYGGLAILCVGINILLCRVAVKQNRDRQRKNKCY